MTNRYVQTLTRTIFLLAYVAGLNQSSAQPADRPDSRTPLQQISRDIFREVIEIKTTVDIGCTRAAEAMAKRLKEAGFDESDIHLLGPRPQNKNLVLCFRGKKAARPVLFFAHLDVVEARKEDWSIDPFTFIERDGFFYGRGTNDMKCEVADIVANLITLKKEGFVPNRDIIVALTDDEENGDANGIEWLLANQPSLIDAEFAINLEGGGGDISKGKHSIMEIQTGEKVYVSFQLDVKNPGGHSSMPIKENAIYRLAAALLRVSGYEFPFRLNETTRTFFERMAHRESGQTKGDILAILRTPPDTAALRQLSASSPYFNALLRTTWVATMINGGHAENALPQSARAVVNCRMLPGENPDYVLKKLVEVVADTQVTIMQMNVPFPSPVSPLRKDVVDIVERLTQSMWPGVIVTPVMSTGASDGKYLRHGGIPVYGISGMFGDIDDVRAHGRDERIAVGDFERGVQFMNSFIKSLTQNTQ